MNVTGMLTPQSQSALRHFRSGGVSAKGNTEDERASERVKAAAKKAANRIKQLEKEARDRIAASRRNGGFASLPSRLQLEQSEGVRQRMRERKHVLDVARQDRGWHEAHARTQIRAHIARIMVCYKVLHKSVKRTTASPCLQSHDW